MFFLLVLSVDNHAAWGKLQPFSKSVQSSNAGYQNRCTDDPGTIGVTLRQLSSGAYDQIQKARKTLLNFAHQSNACRREVIDALIGAMDKPNLDFETQPSNYYLWREGSQLLGELRATEALDLLISHLDATNGFHSASMVFQPAILGVREMGKAAVPKLALALKQNPKPRIRMAAAYCLTDIGGEAAMQALAQVQADERNWCVANFIRISLNTFRYNSKNGIAFDNEAPQANSEARRSWLLAFQCVQ
ncbi:MAG TPA: HEAT repeat domain-containing protein [Candidatus Saccharimonadales bacterium]|nr:HEAT repeat domain-containing protein [Candidatus Saccharimonadales bacterium]